MAKEEKEYPSANNEEAKSGFAERMQDVRGVRIIKAKDAVSEGFIERITDGSGMKIIKKKEDDAK
jgi:ribosomal protein L34